MVAISMRSVYHAPKADTPVKSNYIYMIFVTINLLSSIR